MKETTVRKELAPVKALFATAYEEGLIRANPAAIRLAVGASQDAESVEEERVKALD